jgi:uncharacterized protein
MARDNGARLDVVECFALLHDSQRMHDGIDGKHGVCAGDYAHRINRELLHLDAAGLDQLIYACEHHSDGLIEASCWRVE